MKARRSWQFHGADLIAKQLRTAVAPGWARYHWNAEMLALIKKNWPCPICGYDMVITGPFGRIVIEYKG